MKGIVLAGGTGSKLHPPARGVSRNRRPIAGAIMNTVPNSAQSWMSLENHPATLLLGVPVEDLTMNDCLDAIDYLVNDGRAHGRGHQVATVNVDFLVNALETQQLHSLLQSTSLNLADGLPLVWGSRLGGLPVRERVAGADLVPLLAAESERRGWSIHFFGSAPGVVDRALASMRTLYPGAQLSGESAPMISDVTNVDDALLDGIAARNADIVCVALGNPKQELFISSNLSRMGCSVAIGIGGSLDMFVGDRMRAPQWAQKIGAEWIVRAAQEPRRLGPRYARDASVFGPQVLKYVRKLRHASGGEISISPRPEGLLVAAAAQPMVNVDQVVTQWIANVENNACALHLNLGNEMLSRTALSHVVSLIRRAQSFGREIKSAPIQGPLRLQLTQLGLSTWFDELSEHRIE